MVPPSYAVGKTISIWNITKQRCLEHVVWSFPDAEAQKIMLKRGADTMIIGDRSADFTTFFIWKPKQMHDPNIKRYKNVKLRFFPQIPL